ncbi:hypothetical protein Lfu02_68600 [Longispora fulva]|uniref:Uncharacterized protein n=1 Tax=Longispora fulva TaxID=619741 RepID=A0A8J7KDK9_9ACTN|nr:hypothetical protein [Longispora fulva]MBG6134115.1 hypothetical protein [Longispora fulva]GIG62488.1 hypothetical protein Lfu02_68600 [Longispora fulva]
MVAVGGPAHRPVDLALPSCSFPESDLIDADPDNPAQSVADAFLTTTYDLDRTGMAAPPWRGHDAAGTRR